MGIIGKTLSFVVAVIFVSGVIVNPDNFFTANYFALVILGITFWGVPKTYELTAYRVIGWLIIFGSCYAVSQLNGLVILLALLIYTIGYIVAGLPYKFGGKVDGDWDFDFGNDSSDGGD
ncbi:hypothetical protein [Catenovulum agarivorans]|uniref:hypothetical protein n=1 Tax=Catenovulum agarivorans TaxID=1172192 RepID=UPI000370F2FB|nr:hypothetical protein [Catenovulum agarivorans]